MVRSAFTKVKQNDTPTFTLIDGFCPQHDLDVLFTGPIVQKEKIGVRSRAGYLKTNFAAFLQPNEIIKTNVV